MIRVQLVAGTFAAMGWLFLCSVARAGDGVYDANLVINQYPGKGLTEVVREFRVCFDPKGKDRKLTVVVKMVAGTLSPDPDYVTVFSDGRSDSKQKFGWEVVPDNANVDENSEACYLLRHKLTVPAGGLQSGTEVLLSLKVPELMKKKRKGTAGTWQAVLTKKSVVP